MKIFNIALVLAIAVVALLVPFPLSSAHEQVGACSLNVTNRCQIKSVIVAQSDAGLVGKFDHELGKVDLRLLAGRRLKANLEASRSRRSKIAQKVGDRGVSALISALLELTP